VCNHAKPVSDFFVPCLLRAIANVLASFGNFATQSSTFKTAVTAFSMNQARNGLRTSDVKQLKIFAIRERRQYGGLAEESLPGKTAAPPADWDGVRKEFPLRQKLAPETCPNRLPTRHCVRSIMG